MTRISTINRLLENKLQTSLVILVLGLFTASLFYFALPTAFKVNESSDFHEYYLPAAVNLVDGKGLVTFDGQILTRYPPGHAIFLASAIVSSRLLAVDRNFAIYALLWFCFGLISVMIYLISNQYWNKWISIIPSIIWMTYLPALWSAKQPNSEIPFILVLLVGLWLFLKLVNTPRPNWSVSLFTGLLFGLSMLIRPIALLIGFLLFLSIVLFKNSINPNRKLIIGVIFLLGAYLPALYWGVYLKATTGEFLILSTGGPPTVIDGLTFSAADQGYRENSILIERLNSPKNIQSMIMERNPSSYNGIFSIIVDETRSNPIGVMELFLIKAVRSWYGLDSMRFETYIIPYQALYLILIIISFIISINKGLLPKDFSTLIAMLVLYFWGMTTIALSILRYMIPVFPLLFMFIPSIFMQKGPWKSSIEYPSLE